MPVVLVHGIVDNRSAFALLQRALRRGGFRHVSAMMNYPILTADVRDRRRRLSEHVERVCEETGADRVHLVGHSLGGIVARWYVQRAGGDARVDTLVTLGSPHAGTHAARLMPLPVLRQLRPGSAVLRELAGPAAGCRTRFVSVWSEQDEMVLPRRAAALEHPDLDAADVALRGVGHLALTSHPRAVAAVMAALATHLRWQPPSCFRASRGARSAAAAASRRTRRRSRPSPVPCRRSRRRDDRAHPEGVVGDLVARLKAWDRPEPDAGGLAARHHAGGDLLARARAGGAVLHVALPLHQRGRHLLEEP